MSDDRYDVMQAVSSLGVLSDARDWDGLRALLADTVTLDYTSLQGGEPATLAAADIVAGWSSSFAPLQATQHLIGNHLVQIDGDQATCLAYFQATHVRPNLHGGPHWTLGGRYDVRLRRVDRRWRIAALTMTAVWAEGNQMVLQPDQA